MMEVLDFEVRILLVDQLAERGARFVERNVGDLGEGRFQLGEVFAGGVEGFAQEQEARGVVGDGERVAVAAIAELELAFEVDAPEIVGRFAGGERRTGGAMTPAQALDEAVAIEDRVDRALGWDAHVAGEAANQDLADLARAPMRLAALLTSNLAAIC